MYVTFEYRPDGDPTALPQTIQLGHDSATEAECWRSLEATVSEAAVETAVILRRD
jgi:hypothetical protein